MSRVRRLLDLDADAQAIDRTLGPDPLLAPLIARTPGIRVPGSTDPEETLFRALIGQQVSVAAARTALTRLARELGQALPATQRSPQAEGSGPDVTPGFAGGAELSRLFPTATAIAEHGREVLRGPAARVSTIVATAEALSTGELVLSPGDRRDELSARLQARPGIGPWTAGYVAMRVLGSPDILLTSDLALRQGAGRLGLANTPAALAARGAAWAPWQSYAGMHLWAINK